jgi:hypothetical protein
VNPVLYQYLRAGSAAAGQSPSTTLAAAAWSSVAPADEQVQHVVDEEPGSAVQTAIVRTAPADSFIFEAQDEAADDG